MSNFSKNKTEQYTEYLVPVILSGGSGTRLWPSSRKQRPKPFINLNEEGETLFGETLSHLKNFNINRTITVTNKNLLFLNENIFKKHKELYEKNTYILEPFGKNTAPAIFFAAKKAIEDVGDEAILLILSADHLITKSEEFKKSVLKAISLAQKGKIVTFGIKPTEPSTAFGYIKFDELTNDVQSFKEKPNKDIAEKYIQNGYLWNAGIFCFKANTILNEFYDIDQNLFENLNNCYNTITNKNKKLAIIPEMLFKDIQNISIDYAIIEKSQKVSVIPCDIGWSDIGSWSTLSNLSKKDSNNNSETQNTLHIKSNNIFVRNLATQRLITTIGVDNLIVVDTPDALLIANKKYDQEVKELVKKVELLDKDKVELHRTVNRPWGTYTILEENLFYKIKRIVVNPGESLSLQMHYHRSEHWIVVSGVASIINGHSEILIHANESTYIPAGQKHRLTNPGIIDCVLIEVQVGSYLGEDDITRFTDIYGRD